MVKRGITNKKLMDQLLLMELELKKTTAITVIAMAFTIFAITVPLYLDIINADILSITIIVIFYFSVFLFLSIRQYIKIGNINKKIEDLKNK